MHVFCRQWLFCLGLILTIPVNAAGNTSLRLASLEWAPYVSQHLPSEGLTSSIVRSAAQLAGLKTEIAYFPWSRVLAEGLNNPDFIGYFPSFYLKDREKSCYFSGPLGYSMIGFASLKPTHFNWQQLSDLQAYRIGVVQDYANGENFDALVKKKILQTDSAPTDISNLRKLLAGRVDVIVIDKYVLKQLLMMETGLPAQKSEVVFHPRELTRFSMHVCFQRNAQGLEMQKQFDAALSRLNIHKLETQYFAQFPVSASPDANLP